MMFGYVPVAIGLKILDFKGLGELGFSWCMPGHHVSKMALSGQSQPPGLYVCQTTGILSRPGLFHPTPDNVWYCRCLPCFTIQVLVLTYVMGSLCITGKCALVSKLEPYCAPDPEADNWMRNLKAESCSLAGSAVTSSVKHLLYSV
jgi:hypothetical protein